MLNFLPQTNKKQIISEYLFRVTFYLLTFIFLSSVVLVLLYTPSFFFVKYKNDTLNTQLESIKQKDAGNGEDSVAFVKNVNILAAALSDNTPNSLSYSDIIKKITSLKNKDIKITSIVLTKENLDDKKIIVSGVAGNRDSLSSYERDIKIDGTFSSVTFPVANFIKSTDLEFSATLTYQNR